MFDWQFNDLLYLLDLFIQPTNHIIGGVRNLFYHHQTNQGIHLEREGGREGGREGEREGGREGEKEGGGRK